MAKYFLLLIAMISFCSCLPKSTQTGMAAGAAAGGLLGQAIGKDTEATLIGAALGGALGYMLSEAMAPVDREKVINVYEYNPDNHTSKWVNEQTGSEFRATPQLTYVDNSTKLDCRDVEIVSVVDGKVDKAIATACRKDGEWYFK